MSSTTNISPWLNAWHDPLASIKTTTECVCLADLSADGDSRLLVCSGKKLKIYRGTSLAMETELLDFPVAVGVTYSEINSPRIPSVAVAAGSYVFIYRQLRPYRKWTCPSVEIVPEETEVWSDLKIDMIDVPTAIQRLLRIREEGLVLSARSMDLILMDEDDHEARLDYVNDMKTIQNYTQQTLLTCMTSIKKDSEDPDAITYLVVGTESGRVYVLPQDASGSSFLCKVSLPPGAIPTLLLVSGLFDVEWRILAACRDGRIYTIKSGSVRGTAVVTGNSIDCGCQIVSMAKQDKFIWVATMDKQLVCYSVKGKRTSTIVMNDDIVDVTCINIRKARTVSVLLVALASGEVRIYKDNKVFHSFCVEKPITALCFGPYGREENSLVIAHGQGSLTFKILKRKIDFDSNSASASGFGAPAEQDTPLAIPKKTKLYVEQTQRERELASDIHRIFQKDLCRLRLETARAYVKTLTDGNLMGASVLGSPDVRVTVDVQGLGPKFLIRVSLQVTGTQPILQTRLMFTYNGLYYNMGYNSNSRHSITVPVLLPGPKHIVETEILNIDPQGRSGSIGVMLSHSLLNSKGLSTMSVVPSATKPPVIGSYSPILYATVKMPISEMLDV